MAWHDEGENPWRTWLSKHTPGVFAHPNSPAGGTGYGRARKPGVLECDTSPWNVPHPNSPAGRYIKPTEAASGYLTFEFEKVRARVRSSTSWDKLREAAVRALGPQSLGLGVCYGVVKNPTVSVAQLVQLQKKFIEADLYDRLTQQSPWWKRMLMGTLMANPGGMFIATALVKAGKISPEDLKRAYEMREALIKEVGEVFAHSGEFFEKLKDQTKASCIDKWTRFNVLRQKTDLKSQFEAGEIFGDVLMEVVMLVLTVVSAVGAARQAAALASKLAARCPQLVRVTEYFRGIRVAEAGVAAEDAAEAANSGKSESNVVKIMSEDDIKPPVGTVPKNIVELAKTPGSSPMQRSARLQVADDYYNRTSGLGSERLKQDIRGIDLNEPVEVVHFPPPETMTQHVRQGSGRVGNFFDPVGGQSAESMGISSEGREIVSFKTPPGEGLRSTAVSIVDNWTNSTSQVLCNGGGQQIVVGDTTKAAFIRQI